MVSFTGGEVAVLCALSAAVGWLLAELRRPRGGQGR